MQDLSPVAQTALYCCALRAADASGPQPLCGDTLASRFLDADRAAALAPLLRFRRAAASNVARHRLFDDLLRQAIAADPTRRIILLGAGFDTRAFRLRGGRWWEIEDEALLTFKEARLPAHQAPNPLTRAPVSFQQDPLPAALGSLAGDDPAVVVLEGVSMYLPDSTLQSLAETIRATLPRATLICDLMSGAFARWFGAGLARELHRRGAPFIQRRAHPRHAIEAAGFRRREVYSIVGRACDAGTLRFPRWLLNTLLREMRDGYAVWVFEPAAQQALRVGHH